MKKLKEENTQHHYYYVDLIVNFLNEHLLVDFSEYKRITILRRIKRRAALSKHHHLKDYLEFLKQTPEEIKVLAKDFLISVTLFFRDKEAFEFLDQNIIPKILDSLAAGDELKMWVAACATGEEAYSFAILLYEHLKRRQTKTVVKIFATDIDAEALAVASKGIYNLANSVNMESDRIADCFIKEGNNHRIKPEIRKMVIFARHDLVKNPPYCNMQLISCRNLLIYLSPTLQKKIYAMLLFGLKVNGYLLLGSSENPSPIIQNLEEIHPKWKIYKNLNNKKVARFDALSLPPYQEQSKPENADIRKVTAIGEEHALLETLCSALANEQDSLVVCVDSENKVVKTYGLANKFLLQKHFTNNLLELLPTPLLLAFHTTRKHVQKSGTSVVSEGIRIDHQGQFLSVNMTVLPLSIKKNGSGVLALLLKENREASYRTNANSNIFDEKLYMDRYLLDLQMKVATLKSELKSVYERLDASNEHLQSFSEELLSANEEMQSSQEEMQSVNEELQTMNAGYQLKNKELQELNDELNNYFRSNVNGQLYVNDDLLLIKFSPAAAQLINLLDTDIGRPLSDLSMNIHSPTIIEDIRQVIETGKVITKEINTLNGKWYQLMTMPYLRQPSNKRSGAILTFIDITLLKETQRELDQKNQSLLRVNVDLDNFVLTASHDLQGPLGIIEASIDLMNAVELDKQSIAEFHALLTTSIKKFRDLIKSLATVVRIENEASQREEVDLTEILDDIEWSLSDKITSSRATIHRTFEVETIHFSKKNLRSILYNLLSNALKYKGDNAPVISVQTKLHENLMVLSVEDNGIGIPENNFKKIFTMFGRLENIQEGTGVGLHLVRKIVDAAGGEIQVESTVGKGTKFSLFFERSINNIASTEILND